VEGKLGIVRIT